MTSKKDPPDKKNSAIEVDFSQRKKFEYFDKLIQENDVFIVINANHPEVEVPSHLKSNYNLSLRMSMAFNYPPVYDLQKINTTLKFSGEYFDCKIPWNAIYAISDTEGQEKSWPEDVPKELAKIIAKELISKTGEKIKEKLSLVIKNKKPQTTEVSKKSPLKDVTLEQKKSPDNKRNLELVEKNKKTKKSGRNPNLTRIK